LENIVYLELLHRGWTVYTGRVGRKPSAADEELKTVEVDFVAQKPDGETEYYQVALSAVDKKTFIREIRSLEAIDDNYPKYLLTMDAGDGLHKGIKLLNVLDWLLAE
jgi:predicted AAA+ superfamily ATPase